MLIQRLIQSIRNIPGAILRLLRAILLPIILRGLHLQPNSPASPCEPSRRGASYSIVPNPLTPVSSTVLLPSARHGDPPNNLSPSMPSPAHPLDVSLATRGVTRITTFNSIPAAPEQIQRHLRRKPTYVSGLVLSSSL